MKIFKNNITQFVILAFVIIQLFSCESNFKEVQKINFSEFVPSGEAEDFNLKYTDSGRIKSVLLSPKMLDYATVEYPFTSFPKGIDLTMYDLNGKKTFVKSNNAISFKGTQIIDLIGNVTITNEEGQKMVTEQLYFDQKAEWFFTDKKYSFTSPTGSLNGEGVDFSKDFKIMNTQRLSGEVESAK
jgi:LPS export ABC transporter protein LptC